MLALVGLRCLIVDDSAGFRRAARALLQQEGTAHRRPEPWPAHHGTRYFARSTVILTGNRSYRAGGRVYHLPAVSTSSLSVQGGL